MKLEDIGFYTLSDKRARQADHTTPLHRCELLLTDRCNFNCPYCRKRGGPDVELHEAMRILVAWLNEGLKNVRFSGGEPTLWKHLPILCRVASDEGARVAISTNGSADQALYMDLIENGVTDFSISLDACCADTAEKMSGGRAIFNKVLENIRYCASRVYTTVGVVITEDNLDEVQGLITMAADELKVSDIRLISAAQWNEPLCFAVRPDILARMPILRYRIKNMNYYQRPVRGIPDYGCHKCYLALDDMAVMEGKHYPCIIHLREGGKPIGNVGPNMREERRQWVESHDCYADPICQQNCLDVCQDYNNQYEQLRISGTPQL